MLKPEIVLKMKEQFKAETMAYAAYDVIKDSIEDSYLKEALEEIMYDEFLHAKFLRSYMMECGVYDPAQHPDCEKAFNKMIED
jgi:rubrerythrin